MSGEFKLGSAFFSVESNATGLRSQIKRQISEAQAGQHITVSVKAKYDRKSGAVIGEEIVTSLKQPRVSSGARRAGEEVGKKYGDGVHSGLSRRLKSMQIDIPTPQLGKHLGFLRDNTMALATALIGLSPILASLASSFSLASTSAAAFLPAIIGAVTGVSTLGFAFSGVLGALKAYTTEQGQAGQAAQSSANSQRSNARAMENAYKAVDRARIQQARTAEESASRIAEAQKRIVEANDKVKESELALIEARKKAQIQLEDLRDAAEESGLSEERASIRLSRAKKELADLQKAAADHNVTEQVSQDDLRDAILNVAEAEHDLKVIKKERTRTTEELNTAEKAGIAGSEEVLSAEKNRKEAIQGLADAQSELTKTQKEAAQAQADAAQAVSDAMDGIADAAENAAAATEHVSAASSKYSMALAKLSPAGREFLGLLIELKGELDNTKKIAETATLPGFTSGLRKASVIIPDLNKDIADMGSTIGRAADELGTFVGSPFFRNQLSNIMRDNTATSNEMAGALVPLTRIFMTLSEASASLLTRLAHSVRTTAEATANFLDLKNKTGELPAFFKKAGDEMAVWGGIVKNLIGGIIGLMRGFSSSGKEMSRDVLSISKSFNEWANSAKGIKQVQNFMQFLKDIDYKKIFLMSIAFSTMSAAIRGMQGIQGIVAGVVGLIEMGPIAIILAAIAIAIAGLSGALVYLNSTSTEVHAALSGLWNKIKTDLGPEFNRFKSLLANEVGPVLKDFTERGIVTLVNVIKNDFVPIAKEAAEKILPALRDAFHDIMKAYKDNKKDIDELAGLFLKLFGVMLSFSTNGITIVATSIRMFGVIISSAINIMSAYKRGLESTFNGLASIVSMAWGGIVAGVTTAWNSIVSVFTAGWNMISAIFTVAFSNLFGYLSWFWGSVYNSVAEWFSFLNGLFTIGWNFIAGIFSSIWNAIYGVISSIWDLIGGRVMSGLNYVSTIINNVMNYISGIFSGIWEGIKNVWNAGFNWVSDKVSTWIDDVKRNFNSLKDGIVSVFNEIPNAVVSAFNHVIDGVNWLFDKVNALPFVQISPIDHITQKFASGGPISGPGTGTSDNVPIMGSNGEWVIREKAVNALQRAYGPGIMQHLNSFDVVGGDESTGAVLRPKFAEGGSITSAIEMLKKYNGRPYVFGGTLANSGGTDCCLPPRSMVSGPNGPKPISELKTGDVVYARDEFGNLTEQKVVKAWRSKDQDIYRVKLNRRNIDASANHPFLRIVAANITEWVRLDELKPGDLVVVLDEAPELGTVSVDKDIAWFFGAMVADGTVIERQIRLCMFDSNLVEKAKVALTKLGVNSKFPETEKNGLVVTNSVLANDMLSRGFNHRGSEKRIPSEVWSWDNESKLAFLEGYADGDGHYGRDGTSYSSTSRRLIDEVRTMHIELGHKVSNISTNNRKKPIVIRGKEVKKALPLYTFNVSSIERESYTKLKSNRPGIAREMTGGNFGVRRVLSIDLVGESETWDIEVQENHCFIADGVVVHNSGWVGSAWAAAQGFPNPDGRRWFDTTSVLSTGHWAKGVQKGGFNINLNPNPGYSGHISGEIAGVPFESGGAHGYCAYGPPSGKIGYFGEQYHSLDIMGKKEQGKDIVSRVAEEFFGKMPNNLEVLQPVVNGAAKALVEGLKNFNFDDAISGLWGKIFDNGGPLTTGFTPVLNSSGMTEQIITGPEIAMFKNIAANLDKASKPTVKEAQNSTAPVGKTIHITQNFYGSEPDVETKFEMKRSLALAIEGV